MIHPWMDRLQERLTLILECCILYNSNSAVVTSGTQWNCERQHWRLNQRHYEVWNIQRWYTVTTAVLQRPQPAKEWNDHPPPPYHRWRQAVCQEWVRHQLTEPTLLDLYWWYLDVIQLYKHGCMVAKRGKIIRTEVVNLPVVDITCIYKYLDLQVSRFMLTRIVIKMQEGHSQPNTSILRSKCLTLLSGSNKIWAISTYALLVIRYPLTEGGSGWHQEVLPVPRKG